MPFKEKPDVDELTRFAIGIIHQLGKEALVFYGKGDTDVRFDEDLITSAELHLLKYFQDRLISSYPEHQLFNYNRETQTYSHENNRYLWIHDPIDGVDNFQTGIPVWGMSLALLDNFWPIFGVFYMPASDDLFYAHADHAAYRGERKIRVTQKENIDDESLLLTYSRFHQHYHCKFPGKIRDLGCTTAHICYVAMGRADAALIANETYQGLAAARVIIEAAGGKILKMDGTGFFLNEYLNGQKIEDHLLVVSPDNLTPVLNCLKRTM
ncbi:MAG: inositol monophosphatase [Deltaproteobacteria bacterium]|nr:inositol monophosphatase [Deltaproteobacteria bacterium]